MKKRVICFLLVLVLLAAMTPGQLVTSLATASELPAPTGLRHVGNGVIAWDPVEGAKGYYVRVTGMRFDTPILGSEACTYDFYEHLLGGWIHDFTGTTIQVQVKATVWGDPESPVSDSAFCDPISIDIPRLPGTVTLSVVDGYMLQWNAVEGADRYIIYTDYFTLTLNAPQSGSMDLRTAIPFPGNQIRMFALDSTGFASTPFSNTVTVTEPDIGRLPVPMNLKLADYILSWDKDEDAIGYWLLCDSNHFYPLFIPVTELDIRALGLPPGTSCQIQVTAVGDWIDYRNSEPSILVQYTADESEMPQLDMPTNLHVNGNILSWEEVEGAQAYWLQTNNHYRAFSFDTSFNIRNLGLPPGEYQVRVRALGTFMARESEFSDPVTIVVDTEPSEFFWHIIAKYPDGFRFTYDDGEALDLTGLGVIGVYINMEDGGLDFIERELDVLFTTYPQHGTILRNESGSDSATRRVSMYYIDDDGEEFSFDFFIEVRPRQVTDSGNFGGGGGGGDMDIEDDDVPLFGLTSFAAFVNGYPNNTFLGGNTINREEFVNILFKLKNPLELPEADVDAPTFNDVAPGRWSYDAIEWAVEEGIVEAGADGSFRPKNKLTRAELAEMLVKAEDLTEAAENTFSDIADHPLRDDILKAVEAGIFTGYTDGTFRPDAATSRYELVAAMVRYLLDGEPTDEMWEDINLPFTDVARTFWAYKYLALAATGYTALPQ